MSVDTNVKGKNLTPYRRLHTGTDLRVLVTPQLVGLADRMRITTGGRFARRLRVELSSPTTDDDTCALP